MLFGHKESPLTRESCDKAFPLTKGSCDSTFPLTRSTCDSTFPLSKETCDSTFPLTRSSCEAAFPAAAAPRVLHQMAREGETLQMSCGDGYTRMRVASAYYGAASYSNADVRDRIPVDGTSLNVVVSNDSMASDPSPGQVKVLTVAAVCTKE